METSFITGLLPRIQHRVMSWVNTEDNGP